ncbi:SMP-30/gluconolactonase/LRE family protein [Sphingomonas cavernae]|uniref:SMP-30/gluconolactonase/LRE family protein n=1 Tax=Sphingomonas cavernae TaxID=2320861 RepID=A0A418WJR9_9SPHN|nr:SMP-30/gluconolactonase/LRE family protein [Sphingomonas cavernae]RJF90274.1 SMP-30/gluconolactonase/LRE family protein [Sphingomonas cavernae]
MEKALTARRIAEGLLFGEGIRWRGDEIVLSDMIGERVVAVDPASGAIRTLFDQGIRTNGLVVLDDGSILVLSMYDTKVLKLAPDGAVETYADLSGVATGYLGDVVMHASGDLYVDDVGVRPFHGEPLKQIGRVILVKPDGSLSPVLENLSFPNGIVISADGRTLFLVQSFLSPPSITAFNIRADGSLGDPRPFATAESLIDGLTADDAGGIWACVPHENEIRRFDSGGEITHRVLFGNYEPIACTIGGPNGTVMAVTAIKSLEGRNIFEEMQAKKVRADIFTVDVPFANRLSRP